MNRLLKLFVVFASFGVVLFLLLGSVLGGSTSPEDVYRHFAVYSEVLSRIKSEYVEEPDMRDVTLGAMNGLLEAIDPYASYLSEDQYRQYLQTEREESAGVGLVLSRKVGYVSVVEAIPGSPADQAGLTTGDMIETIDGVATRDMPLAYAEMALRGKPGTEVKLTVLRVRQSAEPQEVGLTREALVFPKAESRILEPGIGHVVVRSLERGKASEIKAQIEGLRKQGAEKLILDLRRAAVGPPEEGLAVADLFVDEGLLGYVEGQNVARREFRASPENTVSKLPMVVLINRGAARAAEVAAAALLENKVCEVVGERSYGDAAIREPVKLRDGGAVILSIAKYYSPKGEAIQDTGVTPSVRVAGAEPPATTEDEGIGPRPELSAAEDTILQKGIEVLTGRAADVAQKNDLETALEGAQGMSGPAVPLPGRPR